MELIKIDSFILFYLQYDKKTQSLQLLTCNAGSSILGLWVPFWRYCTGMLNHLFQNPQIISILDFFW